MMPGRTHGSSSRTTAWTSPGNHQGTVLLHERVPSHADAFLGAVEPYTDDLVVVAECIFCWYWLAGLCAEHDIEFVLAHALYLECSIHLAASRRSAQ